MSDFIRAEPPFTVVTEARFVSIDEVFGELLGELAVGAESELFLEESRTHLTFSFLERDQEVDEAFLVLQAEPEEYRLVLTEGRFVSARGFNLEQRGTVATLQALGEEERAEYDGRSVYSLTWTLEDEDDQDPAMSNPAIKRSVSSGE